MWWIFSPLILCFNWATAMKPWRQLLLARPLKQIHRFNWATAMKPWRQLLGRLLTLAQEAGFNWATAMKPWRPETVASIATR